MVYSGTFLYLIKSPIYNSVYSQTPPPPLSWFFSWYYIILQQYFPSPFHFGKRERSWPSIPRATLGLTYTIHYVMAYCMCLYWKRENVVLSSACVWRVCCVCPTWTVDRKLFFFFLFFKGKVRIGSVNKQRADTRPYPFPVRYIRLGRQNLNSYRFDDDRSDLKFLEKKKDFQCFQFNTIIELSGWLHFLPLFSPYRSTDYRSAYFYQFVFNLVLFTIEAWDSLLSN